MSDIGMSRADDVDILERTRTEARTCVTLDADFHSLLAFSGEGVLFPVDFPFASNTHARAFLAALPASPSDRARAAQGNADRVGEAGSQHRDGAAAGTNGVSPRGTRRATAAGGGTRTAAGGEPGIGAVALRRGGPDLVEDPWVAAYATLSSH